MPPDTSILSTLRTLASQGRPGAIVLAEQAIDTFAESFDENTRVVALDTILRDLARLRVQTPILDPFLTDLERYIDLLQRDLANVPAHRV